MIINRSNFAVLLALLSACSVEQKPQRSAPEALVDRVVRSSGPAPVETGGTDKEESEEAAESNFEPSSLDASAASNSDPNEKGSHS